MSLERGPGMGRRAALGWLALVVAAALALRTVGIGYLLPHQVWFDSLVLHDEVAVLRHGGDESFRQHGLGLYPQFIPRLVALLPSEREDAPVPETLEEHLERAQAPWVRVNQVVALLSLLVVPATYLLARRFMERSWSVVASALMATSVLHLWFSQQGRPHSAEVSLTLLAVLASLRLRRKPVISSYLLAGAAMSLAVGALQSGVATLLPFAAAILLRVRRGTRASTAWAIGSILLVVVAVRILYPFVFEHRGSTASDSPGAIEVEGSGLSFMGHSIPLSRFQGDGFGNILLSLLSYDPLISVLALVGGALAIVELARERGPLDRDLRGDLGVVLAYAVPYLVVVGLYNGSGQRFGIPLLPFLACLAAFGLRGIRRLGFESSRRAVAMRFASVAIVVSVLATQAFAAWKLSWIRSRPDTATQAAIWIREHIRPGTDRILVSHALEVPLFQTSEALERNESILHHPRKVWFDYQWDLLPSAPRPAEQYELVQLLADGGAARKRIQDDPAGYLRSLDASWLVYEVHPSFDWADFAGLREVLPGIGRRVARFSPDRVDRWKETPLAHQGYDPQPFPIAWFLRVLDARCTGSVIEIWKLDR